MQRDTVLIKRGDYYKYHGSMNINVIENYCPLKVIELSEKHREQVNA